MFSQSRNIKVLIAAMISIIIGGAILKTMGNNPPSAGTFSLSQYYYLAPVEKIVSSNIARTDDKWDAVEIIYSGTRAGNIRQLASLSGLNSPEDVNYHFVVCNGLGAEDGQIQTTGKWTRQWPVVLGKTSSDTKQAIHICVITDSKVMPPTQMQLKRTEALVEALSRKFNIYPEKIHYPKTW